MFKSWKEVKLIDYCEKITVGYVGSMAAHYKSNGVPFLRSQNIKPFKLDFNGIVFIDKDFNQKIKKSELKSGDVVLVRTGYPGTACVIPDNIDYANCSDLVIIKPSERIDPYFLAGIFNSSWGKQSVDGSTVGAAQQHFNIGTAKGLKILLPDILIQKKIGSIIKQLQDAIDNNIERVKLLEVSAQELYKEWFVRMRFPRYKEAKFVKGIPADWKIKPIGEIIDYHIGGGWGNDVPDDYFNTTGYVIRGTDIPGIKLGTANRDVYRFHKASNMKSRELLEGDIVFETAGGSEGQPLGRTCFITQELLDAYGDKVMAASFCKQIRTSSIPSLYLYYFLNYLYDSGLIEAFQTQSTGISNYQFGPFLKFQQIILPNGNLMQEFHDIAITIQKQITILGQQNAQLRATRDRLLPRLISGKLQVKPQSEFNNTENTQLHEVTDAIEKSTEDTKVKSNPFFQRRVLAAYVIDHLKDELTFGHVKLMKLMYLCEHLAEIETASHYHRDAAGPYDNRMIRSIDSQLKKAQWFECKKTGNKYRYTALLKKEEYKNWFIKYYSDKEAGIENLLNLFGKEKTEKAEMVATLYEAWRDLKDKKQLPTEQAIIYEVLNNWHESKQRISEERWLKCLQWMKEKNWIT